MNAVAEIRAFNRFYTRFLGLVNQYYLQKGWSLTEVRVIYELGQTPNLTASQLLNILPLDKGYLSRLLKKLTQAELIEQQPSTADRRVKQLSLTSNGRNFFQQLVDQSETQLEQQLQHLSTAEKTELTTHFRSVRNLLSIKENGRPALEFALRHDLQPGDLSYAIAGHGAAYQRAYGYGSTFEYYVARGVAEFYEVLQKDPRRSRCWTAEVDGRRAGFLCLMNRGEAAQLRFFFLEKKYRGYGWGRMMMNALMDFAKTAGYQHIYLWTTTGHRKATQLYLNYGFTLTESVNSHQNFDKSVVEQRYDWYAPY